MMRVTSRCLALLVASGAFTSCAVDDLRPDHQAARAFILDNTDAPVVYDPDVAPLADADAAAFLADGLTLDEAAQLALLNNRRLQAAFMGLAAGHADAVAAGLLQNPSLGLSFFFPSGGGPTRLGLSLTQSVLDMGRRPERRRQAAAANEVRLLELAQQAGDLVADTRAAYWSSVAAAQAQQIAADVVALRRRALDALRERIAAGALGASLALDAEDALREAELDVLRAEQRVIEARRALAAHLSLAEDMRAVVLTDELPAPRPVDADPDALIAFGRRTRLDLRAHDAALAEAAARLDVERARAWGDASVGVGLERPESRDPTTLVGGPILDVELPIFHRNEAGILRAESDLERLRRLREALDAEIVQQIRAAVGGSTSTLAAAAIARARSEAAQERAQAVRRARELGHVPMGAEVDADLAAASARTAGVEAELDAILAQVELQRALGRELAAGAAGDAGLPGDAPAP